MSDQLIKPQEAQVLELILMRHYKVKIKHKGKLNSREYDKYCNDYNDMGIYEQKPPLLPNYRLYSSNMTRAQQTARLATKREPEILDGVYELTFRSFKDSVKDLPFWYWELRARMQWFFNDKRQNELRKDTHKRLEDALELLIERDEDCIVVMHSFVMRIFSAILVKRGFKGKRVLMAKNGECFKFILP